MKKNTGLYRVCTSCEWIFDYRKTKSYDCPKCGFGSYGARYVFGGAAYRMIKNQNRWKKRKMDKYESELEKEIKGSNYENVNSMA